MEGKLDGEQGEEEIRGPRTSFDDHVNQLVQLSLGVIVVGPNNATTIALI
jgi:hypothetical protein